MFNEKTIETMTSNSNNNTNNSTNNDNATNEVENNNNNNNINENDNSVSTASNMVSGGDGGVGVGWSSTVEVGTVAVTTGANDVNVNVDADVEAGNNMEQNSTAMVTTTLIVPPKATTMTTIQEQNSNNDTEVKTKPTNEIITANGESNGNASTTPTPVTEITIATTTITPAQILQPKQHEQVEADNATSMSENETKEKMETDAALLNFKMLYIVTQLCGLTMIILMGCWIGVHMGGVGGTDNPSLEFNWHPLLMTIGLIFLYGNSILIYRGFRSTRKKTLKITHASIHMGAFILTVIALKAVFDSHNLAATPIPNMYSLHSWLGLSAVLIFCLQYVAGFMAYMVPGLKEQYKLAYMPLHIYFGLFGFVLAIASALMGITEKAIFSIPGYSSLPNSGVVINICGILFVVFGGLVVYLATDPAFKRKPIPEDAVLLTGANE